MLSPKILCGVFAGLISLYSVALPGMIGLNLATDFPIKNPSEKRTKVSHANIAKKQQPATKKPPVVTNTQLTQPSAKPLSEVIERVSYQAPPKSEPVNKPANINQSKPAIDAYQYQTLVRIISAEAKGEPFEGQVAVGAVILNRVESGKFPKTISGNVFKRGEFEPVSNGKIWENPVASAYKAADLALKGWDPTQGALYFYNPAKTSSRWIWSRPIIRKIGDHVFAS